LGWFSHVLRIGELATGRRGVVMARFEVPDGWVAQAYRFALDPTPAQVSMLESHCGAARFAFNDMLGVVKANLDQRSAERSYGIAQEQLTPAQGWSLAKLRKPGPRARARWRRGGRPTARADAAGGAIAASTGHWVMPRWAASEPNLTTKPLGTVPNW
jgi:hypothetical protein